MGGVDSIGDYAFHDCSSLTAVTIKGNVTAIGKEAFYKCSQLTTVNYYGTIVPTAGDDVFEYCPPQLAINVTDNYTSNEFCGISVNSTL